MVWAPLDWKENKEKTNENQLIPAPLRETCLRATSKIREISKILDNEVKEFAYANSKNEKNAKK